jgi:tetratricopeptide (TPR) repeat protein
MPADHAAIHFERGNSLRDRGRHEEALNEYRRASALQPQDIKPLHALGRLLQALGRSAEAIPDYERALAAQPRHAGLRNAAALLYRDIGRYETAIAHCEAAISQVPGYYLPHRTLGLILRERGELEASTRALATAHELNPRDVQALYHLVLLRKIDAADPLLGTLETLSRTGEALPDEERIFLEFACGKAWGDLGDHARAFACFERANAMKRKMLAYDEATWLRFVDRIRAHFTPDLMRRLAGEGDLSTLPIFIVGMPRSGSTLVEQILAAHPDVRPRGERPDFQRALGAVFGDATDATMAGMEAARLRRVATLYLEAVAMGESAPALRITDKMLLNFQYLGHIGLALPNARVIHTCRDPVDTCLSCYSILFEGDAVPYAYDLGELGRFYRAYRELMEHWRRASPPGMVLDVRYEDVVDDLEREARRILAHCGLAWNEACLDFHAVDRPVRTASSGQVRQPIYRNSIGKWRPPAAILAPLLEGLGRSDA